MLYFSAIGRKYQQNIKRETNNVKFKGTNED